MRRISNKISMSLDRSQRSLSPDDRLAPMSPIVSNGDGSRHVEDVRAVRRVCVDLAAHGVVDWETGPEARQP